MGGLKRSLKSKSKSAKTARSQLPPNPDDRPVALSPSQDGGYRLVRKQDHQQDHQEDHQEAAFIVESGGSDDEDALRHIRHEALDKTPTGMPTQKEPSTSTSTSTTNQPRPVPQAPGQAPGQT